MAPFSISCTSCKARLKVRDESAVGEIHTCPRCGSMVMITPPRPGVAHDSRDGEESHDVLSSASLASQSGAASLLAFTFDDAAEILNPESGPPQHAAPVSQPPVSQPPLTAAPAARRVDLWADTVEEVPASANVSESPGDSSQAVAAIEPIAVSQSQDAAELADTLDADDAVAELAPSQFYAATDEHYAEPVLPGDQWVSPRVQVWRQWVLLGGAAAMGVAMAVAVFGYAVLHASRSGAPAVADAAPKEPTRDAGDAAAVPPAPDEPDDSSASTQQPTEDPVESPPSTEPADAAAPAAPNEDEASPAATATSSAAPEETPANEPDDATPSPSANVPAESPFGEGAKERPAELAANSDLLDKFGAFLGGAALDATATLPQDAAPSDGATPETDAAPSEASSEETPPEETPLPRPAPREVDVAARLADPIAGIEFASIPLADFLRFVSDLSTIPITIQPEALAWRGLTPASPVTVRAEETTVEGALTAALTPLRLGFVVEDGHLLVTAPALPERALRRIKHPVDDLTGGDAGQASALGETIVRLVAPDRWKSAGGPGSVQAVEGGLEIEQTEDVHFHVIVFCETLRRARGLTPRTRLDKARFQPQANRQAAQAKLKTSVALNYRQGAELTTILDALGKAAGVSILVDWRAAADAGWPPGAQGSVVADGEPLGDVLTRLLGPMDLAYRVVDGSTLEVTTPEIVRTRIETVFYPVNDLLGAGLTESELLNRIRNELGENHFGQGRGGLHFDAASGHLIAALPQPQQEDLAAFLDNLGKLK